MESLPQLPPVSLTASPAATTPPLTDRALWLGRPPTALNIDALATAANSKARVLQSTTKASSWILFTMKHLPNCLVTLKVWNAASVSLRADRHCSVSKDWRTPSSLLLPPTSPPISLTAHLSPFPFPIPPLDFPSPLFSMSHITSTVRQHLHPPPNPHDLQHTTPHLLFVLLTALWGGRP